MKDRWLPIACTIGVFVVWEAIVRIFQVPAFLLPPPSAVLMKLFTPMEPDRFPPGTFDGEKLLESARKEGAKMKPPSFQRRLGPRGRPKGSKFRA